MRGTKRITDRFGDSLVIEFRELPKKDFMEVIIYIETQNEEFNDYMGENDVCVEISKKDFYSLIESLEEE